MIGNDWDQKLDVIWNSLGFQKFYKMIMAEYDKKTIYPPKDYIFNALKLTSYKDTKVVIVGHDPYHAEHQAHGLSFTVQKGVKLPPSLQNIYKEMADDLGVVVAQDGNLDYLAEQGVLLLNTLLTVRQGQAFSHRDLGWEILTDHAIQKLNELNQPIVFILWGAAAQSKQKFLNNPNHLILKSAHPSPLSAYRGFFGSKPFSKTNEFLTAHGVEPIRWIKAQK